MKLEKPDQHRNYATLSPSGEQKSLQGIDGATVESIYKTYGAILFRGFLYDLDMFRAFTSQFCTSAVVNDSGGRRIVDRERNIQTVNLGNDAFPLHPELSRTPWKPDVCWFACVKPPLSKGETLVCDGMQAVENMPLRLFNQLKERSLRYTEPTTPADCIKWLGSHYPDDHVLSNPPASSPYEYFREQNQVYCSFTRPVLHKPMFAEGLAFGNFLIFSRLYNHDRHFPVFENGEQVPDELIVQINKVCKDITVAVKWQRNDILMLDNTRFMHGRNPIDKVAERLIITLFAYLTFARPDPGEIPNAPWRKQGFW